MILTGWETLGALALFAVLLAFTIISACRFSQAESDARALYGSALFAVLGACACVALPALAVYVWRILAA